MKISSTLAHLVFGYLQTVCPHDPRALLEIETHLGLIQDNLRELNLQKDVHYAYPVAEAVGHGISLVITPAGEYCYNIPVYLYTVGKDTFSELPLRYGRFLPLTYFEYVNPILGEIMTRYNERQGR